MESKSNSWEDCYKKLQGISYRKNQEDLYLNYDKWKEYIEEEKKIIDDYGSRFIISGGNTTDEYEKVINEKEVCGGPEACEIMEDILNSPVPADFAYKSRVWSSGWKSNKTIFCSFWLFKWKFNIRLDIRKYK